MIYCNEPMSSGKSRQVNLKIQHGEKEISICFDNSLGMREKLSRADIMLLQGDKECTAEVFDVGDGSPAYCELDTLKRAIAWVES
jgi:hypothetical protein